MNALVGQEAKPNFALAWRVGAERIPVLPNLQTALEQGYKSLQIESTFGIVVPPKASGPSLTACGRRSDLP